MSYQRSLDEYTEAELLEELERRKLCKMSGICSYCGGELNKSPLCKMQELHLTAVKVSN